MRPARALVLASLAAAVPAGAVPLRTGNGLTLDLDPASGRVQSIVLDGQDYSDAGVYGGLFVRDRARLLEVPPASLNRLPNASFEIDSEPDGVPDGWAFYDGWGRGATMALSADALEGQRSVAVTGAGGIMAALDLAVTGGQRYVLQAMAKGTASAVAVVVWKYGDGTFILYESGATLAPSSTWAPFHLVMSAPANAELADIQLVIVSDGTALVDRARLDIAPPTAFSAVAGTVTATADGAVESAALPALALTVAAEYHVHPEHIAVDVTVTDTSGLDRAIEAGFILPVTPAAFWDHARASRQVTQRTSSETFSWTWWGGIYNQGHWSGDRSIYPFAPLALGGGVGLALGYDVTRGPEDVTFFHSTHTGESMTACFRLGLAPEPARSPRQARFHFVLFRADGDNPFRAALDRYYRIVPAFERRVPATAGWLPYRAPASIPGAADFGIGLHSADNDVDGDDLASVLTLANVPNSDHFLTLGDFTAEPSVQDAFSRLDFNATSPGVDPWLQTEARATKVSGVRDALGQNVLEVFQASWMPGLGWGAVFANDGDPEVADRTSNGWGSRYALERRYLDDALARAQSQGATLDGAFLDWFRGWHNDRFDHRRSNWETTDLALSFDPATLTPALPEYFGHWEAAKRIADDMRARGLFTMARDVHYPSFWATAALDAVGEELYWATNEDDDTVLGYFRAAAGRKPYAILLDADFAAYDMGHALRRALLHGLSLVPGYDTRVGGDYFDDSARVERDRPLFRRFSTLFALEAEAGFEPLTRAVASEPRIELERYGSGTAARPLLLAAWNADAAPLATTLRVDLADLGIDPARVRRVVDLVEAGVVRATVAGSELRIDDTLAADAARLYHVHVDGGVTAAPLVLRGVKSGADVALSWTDAGRTRYEWLRGGARDLAGAAVELVGLPSRTDAGAVAAPGPLFYSVE